METVEPDALDRMLAYHQRVRDSLRDLRRIEDNLEQRDEDALRGAAALAADVIRTLGREMSLHERDEGESLFPRLEQALEAAHLDEEAHQQLAEELSEAEDEHQDAEAVWRFLRHWLWMIDMPDGVVSLDLFHNACDDIEQHLLTHMEREERLIFPAARHLLGHEDLAAIGAEMEARRAEHQSD